LVGNNTKVLTVIPYDVSLSHGLDSRFPVTNYCSANSSLRSRDPPFKTFDHDRLSLPKPGCTRCSRKFSSWRDCDDFDYVSDTSYSAAWEHHISIL